jgi:hypothetical protein
MHPGIFHTPIEITLILTQEIGSLLDVIDNHKFSMEVEIFGRDHFAKEIGEQLSSDVDPQCSMLHGLVVEERHYVGGGEA